MNSFGQIIILNGAPRSGKSSIAAEITHSFDGAWVNIGVDSVMQATPKSKQPGIGLRPGGERPDLEGFIVDSYLELYADIAVRSRAGMNVVVDVGHHDNYSHPLGILSKCRALLDRLPVLWIGVRCPIDVIMMRRDTGSGEYLKSSKGTPIPDPVLRWQNAVHLDVVYDLEVDTSTQNATECAQKICASLSQQNQYE